MELIDLRDLLKPPAKRYKVSPAFLRLAVLEDQQHNPATRALRRQIVAALLTHSAVSIRMTLEVDTCGTWTFIGLEAIPRHLHQLLLKQGKLEMEQFHDRQEWLKAVSAKHAAPPSAVDRRSSTGAPKVVQLSFLSAAAAARLERS